MSQTDRPLRHTSDRRPLGKRGFMEGGVSSIVLGTLSNLSTLLRIIGVTSIVYTVTSRHFPHISLCCATH